MHTEIVSRNDKEEYHGYQEWLGYNKSKIRLRGNYKNNMEIGYTEWHYPAITLFCIT